MTKTQLEHYECDGQISFTDCNSFNQYIAETLHITKNNVNNNDRKQTRS